MNIFAIAISLIFGLIFGYLWGDHQGGSERHELEKTVSTAEKNDKQQRETIDDLRQQVSSLEGNNHAYTPDTPTSKNSCPPNQKSKTIYKNITTTPQAKTFEESQRQLNELQQKFDNLGEICLSTQVPKETLRKLGVSIEK